MNGDPDLHDSSNAPPEGAVPLPPPPPPPTAIPNASPVEPAAPYQAPAPLDPPATPGYFGSDTSSAPDPNAYVAPDVSYDQLHDAPKGPIRSRIILAALSFLILVGLGIGGFTLFNQSSGQPQIASSNTGKQVAEKNLSQYTGDGSDIIATQLPTTAWKCPSGYTQTGTDQTSTCTKTVAKSVSAAQYACPAGYTKSGSGSSTSCSTVVGGTTETTAASKSYVCPSGYGGGGSASASCTKTTTNVANVAYSCSGSGFLLNSSKPTQCTKTTTSAGGTVTGNCSSGYTKAGSGASTTCTRTVAATASTSVSCPSGYTRSGSSCTRSVAATETPVTSCPSGYSLSGSSTCYKYLSPVCASGATLNTNYDPSRCTSTAKSVPSGNPPFTRCPSGYSHDGASQSQIFQETVTCTKVVNATAPSCPAGSIRTVSANYSVECQVVATHSTKASCPSGYTLSGSTCKSTVGVSSHTTYSCASGTVSGSSCRISGAVTYSCASGFSLSGTGTSSKCSQISITTEASNPTYSCPASTTASGSGAGLKCSTSSSTPTQAKYSCPSGQTLSGTNCTHIVGGTTQRATPTISYACPAGYTQTGAGASMTCSSSSSVTTQPTQQYSCPDGWLTRTTGTTVDCVKTK